MKFVDSAIKANATVSWSGSAVAALPNQTPEKELPVSAKAWKTANHKGKLAAHFIVLSLIAILFGKLLFGSAYAHLSLYIYGVVVTSGVSLLFLFAIFRYVDPYEQALVKVRLAGYYPRSKPLVSCLVAVKNEVEFIEDCIQSMLCQKYDNKEVIVIDDASTDGTDVILRKYARQGRIRLISLKRNVGKKRALAYGMLKARGEIFAFTDSDSIWECDALDKIVLILQTDPAVGAVSGHCRALNWRKNLLTRVQDSWYEGQFSIRKAFESVYGAVTCVSGPLAVFRRAAILNYIPAWVNDTFLGKEFKFATDRTLTGFVLGSGAIGASLKRQYARSIFITKENYPPKDWKVVYCKSAKALTNVPETFPAFIRQQVRWKKSFIRNIFFTGAFYWRQPFIPALYYYLHIVFVLVGPAIAFRHLFYLPLYGDWLAALLYLAGIVFIGFLFGLAYKLENRECHRWVYRPLMSLFSTLVLSWLIFYSVLTIKKPSWSRG